MSGVPPVVDHASRARIQEAVSTSPFNVFNIVAIVVILVLGFYLYKKFMDKKPNIRFPLVQPEPIKKEEVAAPIPEDPEDEVPETKED
jgi:cell division protein FtsN